MKIKPLIPFRIIDKYKYAYFVINSAVFAILCTLANELINEVSDFSFRHLLHRIFFMWGPAYIVSFVIYEAVKRNNEKLQEKN